MTATLKRARTTNRRVLNDADAHVLRAELLDTGRKMGADVVIALRRAVLDLQLSRDLHLQRAGRCWEIALEQALRLVRADSVDAVHLARNIDAQYRAGFEAWTAFENKPPRIDENTAIVASFRLTCIALRRATKSLHLKIIHRAWSE